MNTRKESHRSACDRQVHRLKKNKNNKILRYASLGKIILSDLSFYDKNKPAQVEISIRAGIKHYYTIA
jgi:hypothetical protein